MSKQPESKVSTAIMKKWRDMGAWCILPNGCWEWQGYIRPNGYGAYENGGVHRYVYELFNGKLPEGHIVDHTCHDPEVCKLGKQCPHRRCVNPDHLRASTTKENLSPERCASFNGGKTHCKWGHEFTPANTRYRVFKKTGTLGRICCQCLEDRRKGVRNGNAA